MSNKELTKITQQGVRCKKCGDEIYSNYRHDYMECKCGSVSIDGGLDYMKCSGNLEDIDQCERLAYIKRNIK